MARLFGTDGVRGVANVELTPELAYNVGRASAYTLCGDKEGRIVVGRDTRKSGTMIEAALVAGITSVGKDVISVGIVPTPGISYLTREYDAQAGIVISASHNPGEYNGIKLFDGDGLKLPDSTEDEIEELIKTGKIKDIRPVGKDVGVLVNREDAADRYMNYIKEVLGVDLTGMKIAMDCGHGALFKIGPEMIRQLNGQVVAVNTNPDGMNINDNCGSTNPQIVQDLVIKEKADIGISFDGDGDRIIAVDDRGNIVDGDHILSICATKLKEDGNLKNDTVVGTVMTNMGLDKYLESNNMKVVKTAVGDRYILEEMLKSDYSLGGEQSGHIIFLDYNTTGDGLATGLFLLRVIKDSGKKLSELNNLMQNYPQVLVNANVANDKKYKYLENIEIKEEIDRIEDMFQGKGRVVIRPSGTEPLVRVMIEGEDQELIDKVANELAVFIEARIGG